MDRVVADKEQIVGQLMLRRPLDEIEAAPAAPAGKRRRASKSGPEITVVWRSNDDDLEVQQQAPDETLLLELARALGRFAAYRVIQQSKLRQSSEVVTIEFSSQTADVNVGA